MYSSVKPKNMALYALLQAKPAVVAFTCWTVCITTVWIWEKCQTTAKTPGFALCMWNKPCKRERREGSCSEVATPCLAPLKIVKPGELASRDAACEGESVRTQATVYISGTSWCLNVRLLLWVHSALFWLSYAPVVTLGCWDARGVLCWEARNVRVQQPFRWFSVWQWLCRLCPSCKARKL